MLLVIESNVTSELKENIERILRERGVTYCIIIEKYNTVPKATRIETEKGVIKKQIVFPKKGMFGINTDMGKFMENLTLTIIVEQILMMMPLTVLLCFLAK